MAALVIIGGVTCRDMCAYGIFTAIRRSRELEAVMAAVRNINLVAMPRLAPALGATTRGSM